MGRVRKVLETSYWSVGNDSVEIPKKSMKS